MDKVQKSLARIAGQVGGVNKMYEEGEPCLKIVQQVAAARAALAGVGRELLKDEATRCAGDKTQTKKFDKILKQLFKN